MFSYRFYSTKTIKITPSLLLYKHKPLPSTLFLYDQLINGNRVALSKAITLVESTKKEHREQANHLLNLILHHQQQSSKNSFRIGLTGPPGVGKSTFIEAFGLFLIEKGHRVAVLAIDPSSQTTGGSILGDKTRMYELSRKEEAFVRPSPSSGTLGGVGRSTSESILLCEASGYDVIMIETVGVGQSETMVSEMSDLFTLLIPPGGGDELQGLKKGIVELADLILINKADGALLKQADQTQAEYISALKILRPKYSSSSTTTTSNSWRVPVLKISSLQNNPNAIKQYAQLYETVMNYQTLMRSNGLFLQKRKKQQKKQMYQFIQDGIVDYIKTGPISQLVLELEQYVLEGKMGQWEAAEIIWRKLGLDSSLSSSNISISKNNNDNK